MAPNSWSEILYHAVDQGPTRRASRKALHRRRCVTTNANLLPFVMLIVNAATAYGLIRTVIGKNKLTVNSTESVNGPSTSLDIS